MKIPSVALALCLAPIALFGCSSDSDSASTAPDTVAQQPDTSSASTEASATASQNTGVRLVSVDDAVALASDATISIIDVRTADEFAQGHIANATEIDFYAADFRDQLTKLDPNSRYLIYCHSGNRSGQARAMMTELGFTDVADLNGGITAWTAAGRPTTR